MTYFALVVVCLISTVVAADEDVQILRQQQNYNYDGTYQYEYELSNGQAASEQGQGGVIAQGDFRYVSPEGIPISLQYVADENGFHPVGDHLPIAPETPPAILRALEYIRAHPPPPEQEY